MNINASAAPARTRPAIDRSFARFRLPIIAALLLSPVLPVLAKSGAPPMSQERQVQALSNVAELVLPATDVTRELATDKKTGIHTPLRYAVAQKLMLTPATYGTWESLPDGRLWRLRISSTGATDLNLGFTTFWLPEGATLHVLAATEKYFQGPYTSEDNTGQKQLWTPVVPGDTAIVELFVPATATEQPQLVLAQVGTGYRDLFRRRKDLSIEKAESCEIDVACPAAQPWANEIRSVARYSISGSTLCSGTLIADVSGDMRNYFLTANHCGLSSGNAASVVVYWNYQSPTCGQRGGGSLAQNQSGAIFRAAKYDVDFALIELSSVPDAAFDVHYAGWDRTGKAPSGCVGIHHPNADEKSISFSSNALTTADSCIGTGGTSTHWQVVWSAGVTEPGSSGSGIWNPSNHRLIGTLSGGGSDCTTPSSPDCYGKFSVAWASGSSSADRLRDWLDPLNTGVTGVDGNDPAGVAVVVADGYSVVAESCTPANNAIDPGETVTLGFNLKNNGGANTTNLVATLLPGGGVVSPSGPQTYGVLVAGGPLVSRPFTFTANAACGGTVTARLRVQDGTGKIRTNGFLVPLGIGGTTVIFSQNFDGVAAPGLPSGWSSSITGAGTAWATTTAAADTAPNSVFADDPGHVTDNLLVSPPITITSASSQLTFRHSYNTEDRYDGGVLEISSNGGTFKDILSAGGSFLANGYNQSIPTTFSSPIGGRAAWSGNSGGFVTTTVSLPASAAGKSIRLRWRLGSDASVAGSGWHVDTVSIAQTIYQCCSLAATDNAAPALIITSHVDLQQVATTNITVSGTASDAGDGDNGIASVTVKGIRAVGDTTTGVGVAAWSRTISLVNGINPVKVVATDFAGNATTNVIRLILDPFRPTVSIVSPTAGQRVTNTFSPVVARGTAADNVQVTNVQVWLNAGPWTNAVSANGWSNWTASIVPVARTNLLKAFSVDEAGRKSSTNAVSFIYVVTSPLTLVTNGIGTITRGFSGSVLEVGRSYSVTAVPGAGQVFSNWDGSVTSTNPMLTFVMQTNMILTANFIPNPFLRARGTYYGLFSETNRAQARSGFFTITLDENGSFSASLLRGTNTFPFTGHFDLSGLCSATVISAGTNSWNVTMALDLGTAEDLIGVIGNAQWLADLRAHRAVFNSVTNPATRLAGKYTLIIPGATNEGGFAPEGDGYGAVTVGPGGYVTLNGSLADGNALSQVVPLSRNGDWPLYQSRYSGKGSVWGWLAFDTNTPSAGISGLVSWIKQAVPAAIYYPAGFTNLSLAEGSRYTAPATATNRVIALTNGALIFEGGNLSASFTNLVTLTTTNRVLNDSPNTLNLAFTPSNGVFSGSVKVPGTTRTNAFKGALLQDLDSGYGFFLGTNRSGRVFLRPEP